LIPDARIAVLPGVSGENTRKHTVWTEAVKTYPRVHRIFAGMRIHYPLTMFNI
jgi:hypothetical protein